MHQSQVSRILSGQAKRSSENVLKLCKYASKQRSRSAQASIAPHAEGLSQSLLKVWNGTEAHAQALFDLIAAVDRVQAVIRLEATANGVDSSHSA